MLPPDPLSRSAEPLPATSAETPHSQSADWNPSTDNHPAQRRARVAPLADPGRYSFGGEIAHGGMGVVYYATDTTLDREVAVKVLQDEFGPLSATARRFLDEARITGQLQHPGIPPVHDLGTSPDGRPFLVMKLIKGETLQQRLDQRAGLAADRGRFVAVFEQVCQAVAYAHAHQVIHRDLKPANVMVGAFGEVQVMDWGLAKVLGARAMETDDPAATTGTLVRSLRDSDGLFTQAGSVMGTPAYMPPEQASGAVDQIDARSDVFGLGGILCSILSGRPPFVADSAEATRQLAALGKLADAFARLDGCGAEPDLVALCKRCLSRDKEERPADAGKVAQAVADLRAAADERAQRAELDRVKAEGEKATAEARAAERRKRRRLWTGAAAALAAAVVVGLAAVLVVQRRANDDLAVKNRELADEQAKVQERFELAQKAIETFHTGASEDMLLKQPQFKELRARLLKEAAVFYGRLEKLLQGQTDSRSRRALADGYFQLGELTAKIGSQPEALAVHRKALAARRELAAAPGTDVEVRLDLARSLGAVGEALKETGDTAGAMAAFEEERDLAERLAKEAPTVEVRAVLAKGYHHIGHLFADTNKPGPALEWYRKARDLRQELADAHPDDAELQEALGTVHLNIGVLNHLTGKPDEAMASYKHALAVRRKLVAAHPDVMRYRLSLAMNLSNIGVLLSDRGQRDKALTSYNEAAGLFKQLTAAHPAVLTFQSALAKVNSNIGALLFDQDKPEEALTRYKDALDVYQRLADANPAVTGYQIDLARVHNNLGWLNARRKRLDDAFRYLDRSRELYQKLVDRSAAMSDHTNGLGYSYAYLGWTHAQAGHPAEAARDLRQALKRWAHLRTQYPATRFARGWVLSLLAGLAGDAKSGVTAAEGTSFAEESVAALRDALNAGSLNNAKQLTGPDFDPVRGREDFRQLVKKLEAKATPKTKGPG